MKDENKLFTTIDGITYTADMRVLVRCERNKKGQVIIPEGVQIIQERAFLLCSDVTSIIMPDSLTTIQAEAFKDCYDLNHVDFGHGIKEIGYGPVYNDTFYRCKNLRFVSIPAQVKRIGSSVFANSGLKNVELNEGLEEIEISAFKGCPLSSISLPSSLKFIDDQICNSLTKITLKSIPRNFIYKFVNIPNESWRCYQMLTININGRNLFLPSMMDEEDREYVNKIFNKKKIDDDLIYNMYKFVMNHHEMVKIGSYIYNEAIKRGDADKVTELQALLKHEAARLVSYFNNRNMIGDAIMVINFGFLSMTQIQNLLKEVNNSAVRAYLLANISKNNSKIISSDLKV